MKLADAIRGMLRKKPGEDPNASYMTIRASDVLKHEAAKRRKKFSQKRLEQEMGDYDDEMNKARLFTGPANSSS